MSSGSTSCIPETYILIRTAYKSSRIFGCADHRMSLYDIDLFCLTLVAHGQLLSSAFNSRTSPSARERKQATDETKPSEQAMKGLYRATAARELPFHLSRRAIPADRSA